MRRLLPAPDAPGTGPSAQLPESPAEVDLDLVYAYPPEVVDAGRPWLRANMVSSLDGAAQADDGLSAGLSSPGDKRIFGVLRALADVVLVGASTVRAEGYRPPKPRPAYAPARTAAGRPPVPVIAIVTRSLELDFTTPLFTEAVVPTVVLTGPECGPDRLAARGWTRLLTEGGPHLLGQLVAAGRLDELCLALGPLMLGGSATRITNGPAPEVPQSMELRTLLEEDGFLFARYVRNPTG